MIVKTTNVKFDNVSQTTTKLSELENDFADLHVTKLNEKRREVDPSIDAIRGSVESKTDAKGA